MKRGTVPAVSVMDQILSWSQDAPVGHRHVACDLRHLALILVGSDTGEMHLLYIDPEKKEDVVDCQATPCQHLSHKEVSRASSGRCRNARKDMSLSVFTLRDTRSSAISVGRPSYCGGAWRRRTRSLHAQDGHADPVPGVVDADPERARGFRRGFAPRGGGAPACQPRRPRAITDLCPRLSGVSCTSPGGT